MLRLKGFDLLQHSTVPSNYLGALIFNIVNNFIARVFTQIGIDIQLEESKESKVAQDRNLNVHLVMKDFGETSHLGTIQFIH